MLIRVPPMPRSLCLAVTLSLALTSMAATAQDSPRRLLATRMMKRMTANHSMSYLEAQHMCKDESKAGDGKPQTAANTQTKPVS